MYRILLALSLLAATFLVSRFIFEPTYLYYHLWWLDIPMHFIGGMEVAYLGYAVMKFYGIEVTLARILALILVVAVIWEIYEFNRDIETVTYTDWYDYFDTTKDTILAILGGLTVFQTIKK